MDPEVLNSDVVDSLINIMPQESELNSFKNLVVEDMTKMAIPDLFFLEIIKVPSYDARLYALRSSYNYKEMHASMEKKLILLKEAYNKQMHDENLKILFYYTLSVANFLNGNTNRGDNYGFKLSEVEKVCDIRSFDHKKTALQYIINKAETEKKQ